MTGAVHEVNRDRRITILAAATSFVAVLVANASGLAISDDGIAYLSIADHLSAGKGLGYALETRLTTWPPLFPVLLSWIDRLTPLDAAGAAVLLNALTAASMVLLTAALLRRMVEHRHLRLLGVWATALGASTMLFGHLLTSDFALGAAVMAMLLLLVDHHRLGDSRLVAAAGAVAGVGFALRYAALAFIPVVAIWLLLDTRRPFRRRLTNAATYSVVAAAFPILWMARNHSIDGTLLGPRWSSARGLLGNTFDAISSVGNLLAPGVLFESRTIWAAVGVLCTAIVVAFALRAVGSIPDRRRMLAIAAGPAGLLVLHICGHIAYLIYARSTTAFDRLSFRLLEPVAGPAVVLGLVVLARVISRARAPWPTAALLTARAWATLTIVVGVGMVPYFATGPDLFDGNYERETFERIRTDTVVAAAAESCPGRVLSNLPNALYGTGIHPTWTPRLSEQQSPDPLPDLAEFPASVRATPTCVLWIDERPELANLVPLAELQRVASFTRIAGDDEVSLYEVTPR